MNWMIASYLIVWNSFVLTRILILEKTLSKFVLQWGKIRFLLKRNNFLFFLFLLLKSLAGECYGCTFIFALGSSRLILILLLFIIRNFRVLFISFCTLSPFLALVFTLVLSLLLFLFLIFLLIISICFLFLNFHFPILIILLLIIIFRK